ncbi:MAG: DUF3589 domain-containing protein [Chlamydiae bacterium]|nr:DUF3589 domain-containing protein [Chlamydiota bacterium]
MKKGHGWLLALVTASCIGSCFFSWRMHGVMTLVAKETRAVKSCFLGDDLQKEATPVMTSLPGRERFCKALQRVSFAEDRGIVKSIKTLQLEGVYAPLNASIVEDGEGYLLFFRYDVKERVKVAGVALPIRQKIPFCGRRMPYRSCIGAVRLDKNFAQVSLVQRIDTRSEFSEDPRAFRVGEDLYLVYNDMQKNVMYSRSMHLAKLDGKTLQTESVLDIDQLIQHVDQSSHVEKNWTPFVRKEANGEEKIYFEYGINPHKILRMRDPQDCQMDHLIFPSEVSLQKMPWKSELGALRGGTPAKLVDGQYLAFFHTLFWDKKTPWYIMGAYTFEASPPYRVTAVSAEPILFRGIYETPAKNTAYSKKKIIYPAGFVLGKEEGKDVLYVSCGENDCAVKILTLDKETLLKSLVPVPLNTSFN